MSESTALPTHYRVYETLMEDGVCIKVSIFEALKETPKGYWVEREYCPHWMTLEAKLKSKHVRFVLKQSLRRYCYPEFSEALESFRKRKLKQIQHTRAALEKAELIIENFDSFKNKSVDDFAGWQVNLGHTHETGQWVFE